MDVHVPGPISRALVAKGVDVLTAQADGAERWADPALVDRATVLGRVMVTQDQDFLEIAARRQKAGLSFSGIIFCDQQAMKFASAIDDLTIIGLAGEAEEFLNRVTFLPLNRA
jgi:hypothetical protein